MKTIIIIFILTISVSLISYRKLVDQNQLQNRYTKVKMNFKNKFTNKKVILYCENGKVIHEGSFNNGKKDGEWITYYKGEKIKSKGNFKNGKKDGIWITYDKSGKIESKEIYNDGKITNLDTISRFSHSNKTKIPK